MQHHPITPTFGTLVEGLSLRDLSAGDLQHLYALWQRTHLLVLRAGPVERPEFEDFAAALGEVEPLRPRAPRSAWDAELSWAERPPFACMLRASVAAGETWFACLPAALRLMAPGLVARLRWLELQHGPHLHPMVIMQPETGEPSLYLGARASTRIFGLPAAESERLLTIAWSYATAPSVTLCHRWQPGDVVVWNNLTVAHRHELPESGTRALDGFRVRGRYTLSAPIQQEAAA
ncbi:MAG: TauD/TfdA dioxygenase family protein [Ramlibacter sp.]